MIAKRKIKMSVAVYSSHFIFSMKNVQEGNKSTKQAGQQKGSRAIILGWTKHKCNLKDMIENTKKLLAAVNLRI